MKIALIIPTMDRGGAEKQVVLLAIGLKSAGHEVHVILLTHDGPRSEQLRQSSIPVHLIGKRWKADPTALFRLVSLLKRLNVDVVHTFLFAANSFGRVSAWWLRRRSVERRPIIVASERSVDPWKQGWNFGIDRRLATITDAITTNSQGVVDFYQQHQIDPALFVVIPNAVEPLPSQGRRVNRDEIGTRLGIDPKRQWIIAVGRLWPQKRVRDLIWAGELLGTTREDTTLLIIGDGPQQSELLRHRDAVSRPLFVQFAGQRDDVQEILPHAAAFWIASEYEGQSNAVIEAMQAGVPVIASNIPGNRDLVIDGQTGWLFEVGDEAELARRTHAILQNEALAKEVGVNAQMRIASEMTLDAMVNRHVELYERLLSRPK